MLKLLAHGVDPPGIVGRDSGILQRALQIARLLEVMRQHCRELVASLGKQRFERTAAAGVQVLAARA
ncbi:hypothetical protein D9M68_997380 [compost metagenome]